MAIDQKTGQPLRNRADKRSSDTAAELRKINPQRSQGVGGEGGMGRLREE
jgi:hypothetical protein